MLNMKLLFLLFLKFLNAHADEEVNVTAKEPATLFTCKDTDLKTIGDTLLIPDVFMDSKTSYTFSLNASNNDLDCTSAERFDYTVNLNSSEKARFLFTTYGILRMEISSNTVYRRSKDFCIQSVDENGNLTLSVCNGSCENGRNKLCIKKCCSIHKVLGYTPKDPNMGVTCQLPIQGHSNLQWKPPVYHDFFTKLTEDEHLAIEPNVYTNFGSNDCDQTILIQTHSEFSGDYHPKTNIRGFRLLANGSLAICGGNGKWVIEDSTYCIDSLQNFGNGNFSSGDLITQAVMRCLDNSGRVDTSKDLNKVIYRIMMPIVSFFLFLVIVVYSLLLDKQCAYGLTVYSYSWSLFVTYIILSVQSFLDIGTLECKCVGVAFHFFFISTFCFLTTISFEIFIKFRNRNSTRRTDSKNMRRFLLYVLFSMVVPMMIISTGLLLDAQVISPKDTCEGKEKRMFLTPLYGKNVCAVDSAAQGWYIYFPIGILLGLNLIFFGITLYNLYHTKMGLDTHLNGNSTNKGQKLMLFRRLFIVMGISWTLEFVGWALKQNPRTYNSTYELIFIFDCINVLQAIIIFYLFVCKKQVFQQLWHKYLWLRPLLSLFSKCSLCQIPGDQRPSLSSQQESTLSKFWSSRKTSIESILSRISRKGSTSETGTYNESQIQQSP